MHYSDGIIRIATAGNEVILPSGVTQVSKDKFDELKTAPKDPEGLLTWLYSNDDYLALMNNHGGIVAAFERQINENRYPLALQLWNRLPVPESLTTALFAADGPLVQYGYQDLIDFANQ